ncbi:hypothetical protein [Nonomuraea sp. NPDC003201]
MGPLGLLHKAVHRTRALTRSRPATGRTPDDADPVAGSLATDSAQRRCCGLWTRPEQLRRDDLVLMCRALGRPKELCRAEELERL